MAAKLTFLLSALTSAEDWSDATMLLQGRQWTKKRDSLVSELSQQMEATAIAVEHGDTLANALTILSRSGQNMQGLISQMKDLPSGVQDSFGESPKFKMLFDSLPESERQSLLQTDGSEMNILLQTAAAARSDQDQDQDHTARRRRRTVRASALTQHTSLTHKTVKLLEEMIDESDKAPTENIYAFNPKRSGSDYGGTCQCPDGKTYDVSDNGNSCGSVQCVGGVPGACHRKAVQARKGMRVICKAPSANRGNIYSKNWAYDGADWGGTCTCPDGKSYDVSDREDSCGSIQCIGGTSGQCQRKTVQARKSRMVICATLIPTPIPTPDPAVPNTWTVGAFNYALGMTPDVSSSCHESTGKGAKYLTDGDNKGKVNKAYYHSCETDKSPAIIIPLNFLRTAHVGIAVGDVKIQNRCDCCGHRLASFSVWISVGAQMSAHNGVRGGGPTGGSHHHFCGQIPEGANDCGTYTVNCGDNLATEVYIGKPGGVANIVEIEVFGSPVTTPKIFTR